MSDVEITRRPDRGPSSASVTRDGYEWTAKWALPNVATSGSRNDRWERVYVTWSLFKPSETSAWTAYEGWLDELSGSMDTDVLLTTWKHPSGSRKGQSVARTHLYPLTSYKIVRVQCDLRSWNSYGFGPTMTASYKFSTPVAPTIEAVFDDETKEATFTVTTDAGTDERERYDTRWRAVLSVSGESERVVSDWQATTATSFTYTYDFSALNINFGTSLKSAKVTLEAYARGFAGDSAHVTGKVVCAYPRAAQIKSISSTSGGSGQGKITLEVVPGNYVTTVQLQRLRNVSASIGPKDNPPGTGWENVTGAVDDEQCKYLYDMASEAASDPGTYTWYRLEISNCGWHNHSWAVRADKLFVAAPEEPTAKNDRCGIVEIAPAKAGTSAKVTVGWTEDTANTGTELSWSDNKAAWSSTTGPSTAEFAGNGSAQSGTGWARGATYTVSSLVSGTTYYVRARRYLESNGAKTYTPYSSIMSFTTESASDDSCGIVSVTPGSDGTSATVVVGYTEDATNTGTEITWSPYKTAWRSNEGPDTLLATWGADSPAKSSDWNKTQTTYIRGLNPGQTYYLRARRYLEAGGNTTFSPYSKLASVTMVYDDPDTTAAGRCGIVSVDARDTADGIGARVVVGWTEPGANTGTELQWTREEVWETNEDPASFDFEWADSSSQSASWTKTGTVRILDLEVGQTYYLRARRYREVDGERAYTPWSGRVKFVPTVSPRSVTLHAPEYVLRGRDLDLSWEYEGDQEQTAYDVHQSGSAKKSLARGEGSLTSATVPASKLTGLASISAYVSVATGGGYTDSNAVTVNVVDRPSCSVSCNSTCTAKPFSFTVTTDTPNTIVRATVYSTGAARELPTGSADQMAGDTAWTASLAPAWTASNGSYTATVEVPESADLVDGGTYVLEAAVVSTETGLASAAAVAAFLVEWARPAPSPSASCSVAYNKAARTATVTLASPIPPNNGDLYDLYRKTADGYQLAAVGLPLACTVTDRHAPFGRRAGLAYRIAVRTSDGDVEFDDYSYDTDVAVLRVDFGADYVELPYNLVMDRSYEKSFEGRAHVDGSIAGYWNRAVQQKGSFTADVPYDAADTIARLHRLAAHAGPCYVRTPDGRAFEADVQVSIDETRRELAVGATISYSTVGITADYMVTDEDVEVSA